jgi:4-diphosphocytidyl-2-C-methyl-D-erythritol kinase
MTRETARVRVKALAKINLDLRVLRRRTDGFHDLRTIFQTVSLGDRLEIDYTPSRRRDAQVEGTDIPGNIALRAAELLLELFPGRVRIRLAKQIPMGAGLGGGSSDAAAVLLALPVLAGRRVDPAKIALLGARLGSDVPFFLFGGTAVAIGRGTELFPMPDAPSLQGVIVAPGVHVSTAEAYRLLSSSLTSESEENKIVSFQSVAWSGSVEGGRNDFEEVVFRAHPRLASLKRRLMKLGAAPAMMTGSGSALFGLFRTGEAMSRAVESLREEQVFPISFVSRAQYHSLWLRWLRPYSADKLWPPQSRYAR